MHIGGNRLLIRLAYTCVIYCCGSTIYCYRSQLKPESSVSNMKSPLKSYVMHKSLLQMLFIDRLTCYLRELSSSNRALQRLAVIRYPDVEHYVCMHGFPPSLFLLNCCAFFLCWGSNTLPKLVKNYFTMQNEQNRFFF